MNENESNIKKSIISSVNSESKENNKILNDKLNPNNNSNLASFISNVDINQNLYLENHFFSDIDIINIDSYDALNN